MGAPALRRRETEPDEWERRGSERHPDSPGGGRAVETTSAGCRIALHCMDQYLSVEAPVSGLSASSRHPDFIQGRH